MKSIFTTLLLLFTFISFSQDFSDKSQIEVTLNNYIDGFYQGDTLKLKAALKPRLYKFGYLKDKETGVTYIRGMMSQKEKSDEGKKYKYQNIKVLVSNQYLSGSRYYENINLLVSYDLP